MRRKIRVFLKKRIRNLFLPTETNALLTDLKYRALSAQYESYADGPLYGFVVFSKDRPLQLHSLLSSCRRIGNVTAPIHVLFSATTHAFRDAYLALISELPKDWGISCVEERRDISFKGQLLDLLKNMRVFRLAFLVDDIIFMRECPLSVFDEYDLRRYIPSLRLSRNITYSYTLDKHFDMPPFLSRKDLLEWQWDQGSGEWSYPLSLDGNVFLRSDILSLLDEIEFTSPNTLESGLQIFSPEFARRKGLCFISARLINIPCNKVQQDFNNRSGNSSIQFLLQKWQEGKRIRFEDFAEKDYESVHVEESFNYASRSDLSAHGLSGTRGTRKLR
jgi:hypothetical protein